MIKLKNIFHKILRQPKNTMSFKETFDLTEMPIVTFYQGDKKINFLLDTGSNNNIIDEGMLKELKYKTSNAKTNLAGVDGINHTVDVCVLTITYKDKDYTYPYLVKDMSPIFGSIKKESGANIHGILGAKFFNKFKYVLDFSELIAYSKQ